MPEVFPKDILLRVGGRTLARHGVLAVAGSHRGLVDVPITFTRADATTCATYIDRDGVVRLAAAGVPRIEWVDLDGDGVRETPGILLEGSRQNLILRSEEADNAAWTVTNVTFSANADTDPAGTVLADRLIEQATSTEHMISQQVTGTSNATHSVSVFAKAGTRTWLVLTIRDVSAGTNRVQAWFNLATGVLGTVGNVGVGTGATAFIQRLGNGWYRCMLTGACNNSDTTPIMTVQVANADASLNYAGDGTSYISVWGMQFEESKAFTSSYVKTVGSAVTRAADSFTLPFNFGPMDCTVLYRLARPMWADASGDLGSARAVLDLSINNPKLGGYFEQSTRFFSAQSRDTASLASAAIPAGASLAFISQHKNLATAPAAAVDVGSGLTAFDTGAAVFTAYAAQTAQIGGQNTQFLYGVLIDLVIARGLFSLAELSAVP